MAYPWEADFWKGKKGETDLWDITSLGATEFTPIGVNPLENYKKLGGLVTDMFTGRQGAEAARDAARIQAEHGRRALELQKQMYEQGRADVMPWLESGRRQLGTLERMMGEGAFEMAPEEFEYGPGPGEFDETQYEIPGEFKFGMEEFQKTPYYDFLQGEGQRAIERSAAARGGLASGATLAGLQHRGQMGAMGEYGRQFGRARDVYGMNLDRARGERAFGYGKHLGDVGRHERGRDFGYRDFLGSYGRRAGQKQDLYNRMAAMAGTGQTASGTLAGLGQGYGAQAGAGLQGIGNVLGAGRIGAAQARQQGMQNLMNLGMTGASLWASDRRLKRDIKPIGKWKGYNKYLFKYLWSPRTYIGLMADEVKTTRPDAVINITGYDHINYGVI